METIENVKTCCNSYIFSLPLAFDESLSYLEQQCHILKKLKEVINQVNKNTIIIEQIDINFEEIFTKLDNMEKEINDFEEELTENIQQQFQEMYNQVISLMNDYQAVFTNELNQVYTELSGRIDDIVIGQINVYNPTTGRYENINKVLTDIYDSVRYDAISCNEFDALELTATDFDDVEITAYNFDNNGKSILTNI